MRDNTEKIYAFVARADNMRRELVDMRSELREFIHHTDYVLPKQCVQELDTIETYDMDDTNNELKWLVTHLASAMVLCEEGKIPPQEIQELTPDQC